MKYTHRGCISTAGGDKLDGELAPFRRVNKHIYRRRKEGTYLPPLRDGRGAGACGEGGLRPHGVAPAEYELWSETCVSATYLGHAMALARALALVLALGASAAALLEAPPDVLAPTDGLPDDADDRCYRDLVPPLPSHSQCVPEDMYLKRLLRNRDWDPKRTTANLSTFFLHEEGVFNVSGMVTCVMDAMMKRAQRARCPKSSCPGHDRARVDDYMAIDIAQHMGDVWILEQLRKHPQRTFSRGEADVHIIGSPLATAHRGIMKLARGSPGLCGDRPELERRANAISSAIRSDALWKEGSKSWVLPYSYYFAGGMLGPELLQTMMTRPSILTTSDRGYPEFVTLTQQYSDQPFPLLPYKAHYLLEPPGESRGGRPLSSPPWSGGAPYSAPWRSEQGSGADLPAADKPVIMFHGSTGRGGGVRSKMVEALHGRHGELPEGWSSSVAVSVGGDFARLETALAYKGSSLCLVPEGDTSTSRRLYDSMAAGCVPVVFSDVGKISHNLPFRSSVPWHDVAVFGGSLDCSFGTPARAKATLAWLQRLAEPENGRALACMKRRAQAEFREHLSYTGPGVVTALLRELSHPYQAAAAAAEAAEAAAEAAAAALEPEPCASWCAAHEATWLEKCAWGKGPCLGCLECTDALQPLVQPMVAVNRAS